MKKEEKPSAEADAKSKAPAAGETKDEPKKPGYVFKIVPADPKNAFDFEDVADK